MSNIAGLFAKTIAGHLFLLTPQGRCCSCGRFWLDIRNTTKAEVGHSNIAHIGQLTDTEYWQIAATRSEEETVLWSAVCAVAGAGGSVAARPLTLAGLAATPLPGNHVGCL